MNLLQAIDDPSALRRLPRVQLEPLARELRQFLLESVGRTGSHLSSNLGAVELTIALHYVFDTPRDRIVWDVGHQSYGHKVLTGTRERMATLRQQGGVSGFARRSESAYDTFGTAHSSTSISAVLGMARAARLGGEDRHCVAVIGDGAMSAGMPYEAMNNAGIASDLRLLVILNDDDMSISPAVGALSRYPARLPASRAAGMATVFEQFGFDYIGPIDSHDLGAPVPAPESHGGEPALHQAARPGPGAAAGAHARRGGDGGGLPDIFVQPGGHLAGRRARCGRDRRRDRASFSGRAGKAGGQ